MKYLCATHVPVYAGQTPGVLRVTRAHLRELSAQVDALTQAGFDDVTLATPLYESIDAKTLAEHEIVELPRHARAFHYVPLPSYRTVTQFVRTRSALLEQLRIAAKDASVVQLGTAGHPVALGQIAWPVVHELGKKRIFVIATDPFPALQKAVNSGRNPAKRIAKQLAVQQFEKFCIKAVREASAVFTHSPDVVARFKNVWHDRCVFLPRPLLSLSEVTEKSPDHFADVKRPLRLITHAHADATRGLDHLLKAVAKARRLAQAINIDLLGDVSDEIVALVRSEKIEPYVRFLGNASPAPAFAQADVYVTASLVPTGDPHTPHTPLALAHALPVVAYAGGAFDERIKTHDAGIILPRGETDLLGQSLIDLSRNRPRLRTLSTNAITLARTLTFEHIHDLRAKLAMECVKQ